MKPENVVKGRIAETLVNELLRKAGHRVYRFGYEAVLQNLTQLHNKALRGESDIRRQIRSIPDFLIVKRDKIFFVEVKFRSWWKPRLDMETKEDADLIKQLDRINQFWKAKVVFVTTEMPYFRISTPPYYGNNLEIKAFPIETDEDLGVSKKILEEFDDLVERYLINTRKSF